MDDRDINRVQRNSEVSFDDLILLMKKTFKDLQGFVTLLPQQPAETRLEKLRTSVERIGSNATRRPPPLDRYMQQWREFVAGKRKGLDKGTARFLCWEPDVATSDQFMRYLQQSGLELNRRPLEGLVRSCHSRWEPPLPGSPSVDRIKHLLVQYRGPNPILVKWKSDLDAILGKNGPDILAKAFSTGEKPLQTYLDEWYLESQSPFVQKLVKSAAAKCREELGIFSKAYPLLFNQLLPWPGWKLSDFKKEIGDIILHTSAARDKIQEALQAFVLGHKELGDPRLPANRRKWAEVAPEAKNRMLGWLCREDIFFFFNHVYPPGTDRQHRKEFWLQYLGRCTASRPLLGSSDALRLTAILQRERTKVAHFGKVRSSDNSAFLLVFGDITVVEFSKVGACYIYDSGTFGKIVPDFWATGYFSEGDLKDKFRCMHRIRHRTSVNIDWRDETRRVLAGKGLRPGSSV